MGSVGGSHRRGPSVKRLVRRLLRLFPDAFRKRYGDELAEFLDNLDADIDK